MFLRDAEIAAPLLDIALTTRDKGKPDAVPMCGVPVHAADRLPARGSPSTATASRSASRSRTRARSGRGQLRPARRGRGRDARARERSGRRSTRPPSSPLVALWPGPPRIGLAVLDASTGELRATALERPASGGAARRRSLDELRAHRAARGAVARGARRRSTRRSRARCPDAARRRVAREGFDAARAPRHPDGCARTRRIPRRAPRRRCSTTSGAISRSRCAQVAAAAPLRALRRDGARRRDARAPRALPQTREDGSRRAHADRAHRRDAHAARRAAARALARVSARSTPRRSRARQDARRVARRARPRCARALRDALRAGARPRAPARRRPRARARRRATSPRCARSLEALAARRGGARRTRGEDLPRRAPRGPRRCRAPGAGAAASRQLLREALVDEPRPHCRAARAARSRPATSAPGFRAELDGLRESASEGARVDRRARERASASAPASRASRSASIPCTATGSRSPRRTSSACPPTTSAARRSPTPSASRRRELREIESQVRGAHERAAALERELFERLRLAALERRRGDRAAPRRRSPSSTRSRRSPRSRAATAGPGPRSTRALRLEIRAGPAPGDRAAARRAAARRSCPNDAELDPADAPDAPAHRPEHVRQEHLPAPGRADRAAGADGIVRARRERADRRRRPRLHARRRQRSAGAGRVDVHGRDARDRRDPGAGVAAQPDHPRRDRPRHAAPSTGSRSRGRSPSTCTTRPACGARTLFATHYHELADLARTSARVANAHFEVREWNDEVVFLRRLVDGRARAARTASRWRGSRGCREPVIRRAREVLENLEGGELDARGRPRLARRRRRSRARRGAARAVRRARARDRGESARCSTRCARCAPSATTPLEALARARAPAGARCATRSRREARALVAARWRCSRWLLAGVDRPPGLVDVKEVRHWSYPDYTRVVIELTGAVALRNTPQLLPARAATARSASTSTSTASGSARASRRAVPVGDGLLRGVRDRPEHARAARVVLDLQNYERHRVLMLTHPDRLVIDVYGARGDERPRARRDAARRRRAAGARRPSRRRAARRPARAPDGRGRPGARRQRPRRDRRRRRCARRTSRCASRSRCGRSSRRAASAW